MRDVTGFIKGSTDCIDRDGIIKTGGIDTTGGPSRVGSDTKGG